MPQSEIASIREQIDAEVQAINLMFRGYAVVGTHQSITQRTERIGQHMLALQELVGEREGAAIVMEALDALEKEPQLCPKSQG